jgi:hypothetical protein
MFYWIMWDGRIVFADHRPNGPVGAGGPILAVGPLPYGMGCPCDPFVSR